MSNYELEILKDRIGDLEAQVLELNIFIHKQSRLKKVENKAMFSLCFFTVPLVCVLILMFGLRVDYQSDNHQISYISDGIVEIALSCLTVASGIYSFKKYREKQVIERDRETKYSEIS